MEADYLIDRRRLKRRIALWRTAAIVLILAAVSVGALKYSDPKSGNYIARLKITNFIHNDVERLDQISQGIGELLSIEWLLKEQCSFVMVKT